MATARTYEAYPIEYTELLRRAYHNPIRIAFEDVKAAKNFREHVYGFRRSIRDSTPKDNVPDDLFLIAPLISFNLDGSALIVCKSQQISSIQKALEAAK